MHILTHLTATASPIDHFIEPRGHVGTHHHELAPGCFVHLCLGGAGLLIHHGGKGVAIPIAELVSLAQAHCEDLASPSPATGAAPTSREELERRARAAQPSSQSAIGNRQS